MPETGNSPHVPVLLEESVHNLITNRNGVYIDGTLGYGGHAESILERLGSKGLLIGLELNPEALSFAQNRLAPFKDRMSLHLSNFRNFSKVLFDLNIRCIHGILLDLGLSSAVIDQAEYGFSYKNDGPLNMLFGQQNGQTAKEFLNSVSESDIFSLLKKFGEEPNAKKISKSIVQSSNRGQMNTTLDLRNAICAVTPKKYQLKTLSRVFQAIRIKVNDELAVLKETLELSQYFLEKGSRIAVISYHSLEDRIVKTFFNEKSIKCTCPPIVPVCICDTVPVLKKISKGAIKPPEDEISRNKRARSARLRISERI